MRLAGWIVGLVGLSFGCGALVASHMNPATVASRSLPAGAPAGTVARSAAAQRLIGSPRVGSSAVPAGERADDEGLNRDEAEREAEPVATSSVGTSDETRWRSLQFEDRADARAGFDFLFAQESVDPTWANSAQANLSAGLGQVLASGEGAIGVECRSTLCRTQYEVQSPDRTDEITSALFIGSHAAVKGDFGEFVVLEPEERDGKWLVTVMTIKPH